VVNNFDKLLLVLVLDDIDLSPGLIFNLLALFFIDLEHLVDLSLQGLALAVLLLLLEVMLNLQFFVLFFLEEVKLRNLLSETFFLFLLLMQKFLVTLVIVIHLFLVFTFLDLKLLSVESAQMLNLLMTFHFNLVFLGLNESVLLIVLGFLSFNIQIQTVNLFFVLIELVLSLLFVSVLVHLDVILEVLDLKLKIVTLFFLDENLL